MKLLKKMSVFLAAFLMISFLFSNATFALSAAPPDFASTETAGQERDTMGESSDTSAEEGQTVPESLPEEEPPLPAASPDGSEAADGDSGKDEPEEEPGAEEEKPELVFDPQPQTLEDVERAIRYYYESYELALETGGEELALETARPRWEFDVEEALVPEGYDVRLVEGDEAFPADYFTFFEDDSLTLAAVPAPVPEVLSGPFITVNSYAELKSALQENNGYTYIYLGSDISQESAAGIAVHPSKTEVVIDGRPEGSTQNATFIQKVSVLQADVIYVDVANTTTKSITMRNIDIDGNNLFGFVSAQVAVAGLALTYENISYTGPQLTYNRNGSAHYSDCTVNLLGVTGGGVTGELAETSQASFSGTVTVTTDNSPNSIVWLTGTGTKITLRAGANVRVRTNHYLIYADASYPTMVLEEGAHLDYTGGYYGLVFADQRLESLVLEQGAGLAITQVTNVYANGSIRVNSAFKMQEGSSLYVNRAGAGPAIQLLGTGAQLIFNNPERVLLYAPVSRLIGFLLTGTMQITTDSVNIWKTTGGFVSDSIDSNPTHVWNKTGNQKLVINSSFVGVAQTLSSNLDAGDPTSNLTAATFAVGGAQMLVFGRFSLGIDTVYDNATTVTGITEHGAALRATADGEVAGSGFAGAASYAIGLSRTLASGSTLYVLAHHNYLQKLEHTVVQSAQDGVLRLVYAPPVLNFGINKIPGQTAILPRAAGEDFRVEVEDTRRNSPGWKLMVSLTEPLAAYKAGERYVLENGLAYVDASGSMGFLYPNDPVLIAQGSDSRQITWAADRGFVLYVNPSAVVSGATYSATMTWVLQDAP